MENKINYVKFNQQTKWLLCENEGRYFFMNLNEKGGTPLTTPGGKLVTTLYRELAERIFEDIERFGRENMSVKSILPWHFTMVDNFAEKTIEEITANLEESFLKSPDWTFTDGASIENWKETFGTFTERRQEIVSFLKQLTNMQLTAMCCIANAHESLNLSYVLAKIMEEKDDFKRRDAFKKLALMMANGVENVAKDYMADFETFSLYYKFHMNEDGDNGGEEKTIRKTSLEDLAGRNYYHYTDGKLDEVQEKKLDLDYLGLSLNKENNGRTERGGDISEFLPKSCWVKILHSGDGIFDYVVIKTDESCNVKSFFTLEEKWDASSHKVSFKKPDIIPIVAQKELENLFAGRSIKPNFKLIGAKLPFEFTEEYRGDGNTFAYAAGSAFRDTFMQIEIEADDEGRVKNVTCNTFKDFGSGLDSMFSSPDICENREDELIDLIVDIVDLYSDEEFEKL